MRVLTFKVQEPLPGQVLPEMAVEHGEDEAARRYRAIVVTTLRQLRGLANSRLRLLVDPAEASEAVRFWILPRLADKWQKSGSVFETDGWNFDFEESTEPFAVKSFGDILCPNLGARWAHAAMLGLERGNHRVLGPTRQGGHYFQAYAADNFEHLPTTILPELPTIRSSTDWSEALASPLGPALKKAWEEEEH